MQSKQKKYYKNSEFNRTIGISRSYREAIREIKGKKSMAGKLKEMIEFYFHSKKLIKILKKWHD